MFGMGTGGTSLLSPPDIAFDPQMLVQNCTLKTKQCYSDISVVSISRSYVTKRGSAIIRFAFFSLLLQSFISALRAACHSNCLTATVPHPAIFTS